MVANDGGATASIFETAADSDTITLNGTTTGGILGGIRNSRCCIKQISCSYKSSSNRIRLLRLAQPCN